MSEYVLVTHRGPDMDALVSMFLWLEANNIPYSKLGSREVELQFVPAGQRYEPNSNGSRLGRVIHFDTGMLHDDFNFDHHQLEDQDELFSATKLVWQKFFQEGEDPAIDELVRVVTHIDNGIRYDTDDLVARNLFTCGFWLSGAHRAFDGDYIAGLMMGFVMLKGYLANHYWTQKFHEYVNFKNVVPTTLGNTLVCSDVSPGLSKELRSYLRKYHNGKNGPLIHSCVAPCPSMNPGDSASITVMVFYDPKTYDPESEDQDATSHEPLSVTPQMQSLEYRLRKLDPNISMFLHQRSFALYINYSRFIQIEDVVEVIKELDCN